MKNSIVKVSTAYDHKTMLKDLSNLKSTYPQIEILNIGKSVLGRSIPAVRLGSGKRLIHYNGAFHANEWITSLLLMVFIEMCLEAARSGQTLEGFEISKLLKEKTLWIVPMVNPDGVDLVLNGFTADNNPYYRQVMQANKGSSNFRGWKANIRGVDLNDQFPAYWENENARRETSGPAPMNYPGPFPLSEPEARAIADFTRENDFQIVMAFHTQGEEIYWGYRKFEPPQAENMVQQLAKVSGYRAVRYVDSDAGYKDWFIYKWRKPGFTIECGSGQNPLPLEQFPSIWAKAGKIMLTGLHLA